MNIQSANERARKSLKRNHPFLKSKLLDVITLFCKLRAQKKPEIQVVFNLNFNDPSFALQL